MNNELTMICKRMFDNMKLILSNEDMNRVTAKETANGFVCVKVDLHGLTHRKAERLVKNIINVNRVEFILKAIHGYNRGTVLKEMMMEAKWSSRVVDRNCPDWNPGLTILRVVA